MPDLVATYLAAIEGKKSKRYVEDLTSKLNRAAKAFNGEIRDIRAVDIDKWLDGMDDAGDRTKNNYRMALVTLFSYARDKNYLPRGEQTEAEFVTRHDGKKGGSIGIYNPQEFATLLHYIDERFLPFVALGGFAGLRSIEILRLEWKDIWFEKGYVEVGRDKSKTATRRLAPICPALEQWLKPYAKKDGPVLPDIRNEVHFIPQRGPFNLAVRCVVKKDNAGVGLVVVIVEGGMCFHFRDIRTEIRGPSPESGAISQPMFGGDIRLHPTRGKGAGTDCSG